VTAEHAIEAHEILNVLKVKHPGTYEDILKRVDLSDSAFEELMGALQKDRGPAPKKLRSKL